MDNIELIDKYYKGELKEEELDNFIKKLKTNPDFAKDVSMYKDIDKFIYDLDLVQTLVEKHMSKKGISRLLTIKYIYRAAIIMILLGIGSVLLYQNFMVSPEKLFSKYYYPYEISLVTRGSNKTDYKDKEFYVAITEYNSGNYNVALLKFGKILNKTKGNYLIVFLSGICYIEKNEIDKAINSFSLLIDKNERNIINTATWYLALCYLKKNNIEKSTFYFNKLTKSRNYYKEKAEKILDKLD